MTRSGDGREGEGGEGTDVHQDGVLRKCDAEGRDDGGECGF